jgi:hypothetical protein
MQQPIIVRSRPGVKRDGTEFDGDFYVDAQWCRFQRGLPRKMGGCVAVISTLHEKVYGMASYAQNAIFYQHLGSASALLQIKTDAAGGLLGTNNRTPAAPDFVASVKNVWQFDVQFDFTGGALNFLFAHPGQNLAAIDSDTETFIFYDDVTAATPLINRLQDPQSGGVVVLAPYVLTYGNAGRVDIYKDPAGSAVNSANVTGMKIVKGLPLRGTGTGAAGIFWSLDSVIRATFTSETTGYFAFDTLSSSSSVMSSRGIIEYDGIYYWVGVDRFLMFNGVVQELPNDMNYNFFFDNISLQQRQKVYAFTVPRFGEIWWCYPRGAATECTHAIVYNVREKTWYDTELLGLGRTDSVMPKSYNKPFTVDLDPTATGFTMWQMETGKDQVSGSDVQPIRSWFESADFTLLTGEKPENKSLNVGWLEPDFVQIGDMMLQVTGRINARAPEITSDPVTIVDLATTPDQQILPLREVRRLMRFRFESNTVGGDYQTGQIIAHVSPNDGRMVS